LYLLHIRDPTQAPHHSSQPQQKPLSLHACLPVPPTPALVLPARSESRCAPPTAKFPLSVTGEVNQPPASSHPSHHQPGMPSSSHAAQVRQPAVTVYVQAGVNHPASTCSKAAGSHHQRLQPQRPTVPFEPTCLQYLGGTPGVCVNQLSASARRRRRLQPRAKCWRWRGPPRRP